MKKAQGVQLGRRSGVAPAVVRRIRRQRASGRTLAWIAAQAERRRGADRAGRPRVASGDGALRARAGGGVTVAAAGPGRHPVPAVRADGARTRAAGTLPEDGDAMSELCEPSGVADSQFVWFTTRALYKSDIPTGDPSERWATRSTGPMRTNLERALNGRDIAALAMVGPGGSIAEATSRRRSWTR